MPYTSFTDFLTEAFEKARRAYEVTTQAEAARMWVNRGQSPNTNFNPIGIEYIRASNNDSSLRPSTFSLASVRPEPVATPTPPQVSGLGRVAVPPAPAPAFAPQLPTPTPFLPTDILQGSPQENQRLTSFGNQSIPVESEQLIALDTLLQRQELTPDEFLLQQSQGRPPLQHLLPFEQRADFAQQDALEYAAGLRSEGRIGAGHLQDVGANNINPALRGILATEAQKDFETQRQQANFVLPPDLTPPTPPFVPSSIRGLTDLDIQEQERQARMENAAVGDPFGLAAGLLGEGAVAGLAAVGVDNPRIQGGVRLAAPLLGAVAAPGLLRNVPSKIKPLVAAFESTSAPAAGARVSQYPGFIDALKGADVKTAPAVRQAVTNADVLADTTNVRAVGEVPETVASVPARITGRPVQTVPTDYVRATTALEDGVTVTAALKESPDSPIGTVKRFITEHPAGRLEQRSVEVQPFQTGQGIRTYPADDLVFTRPGDKPEFTPGTVDAPATTRVLGEAAGPVDPDAPFSARRPVVREADEAAEVVAESADATKVRPRNLTEALPDEPAPLAARSAPKDVQQKIVSDLASIDAALKVRKLPAGQRTALKKTREKLQKMADDHPGCL